MVCKIDKCPRFWSPPFLYIFCIVKLHEKRKSTSICQMAFKRFTISPKLTVINESSSFGQLSTNQLLTYSKIVVFGSFFLSVGRIDQDELLVNMASRKTILNDCHIPFTIFSNTHIFFTWNCLWLSFFETFHESLSIHQKATKVWQNKIALKLEVNYQTIK